MRLPMSGLAVSVLVLAGGLRGAGVAAADTVKVVLMAGQSNMQGFAWTKDLPAGSPLRSPQNDILFYNSDIDSLNPSTLMALQPASVDGVTFGPELTFGRAMADASPADHYAIIKYAESGKNLAVNWQVSPPGVQYRNFKTTVANGLAALVAAGHEPQIVGMLWLQGESDATAAYAGSYEANLTRFINDMRANYGEDLPFIIGGIGYVSAAERAIVMQAQANVAASLSDVRYFSNDDINSQKFLHFEAPAMQTIGTRFADQLQAIPEPSSIAVVVLGAVGLLRRRRVVAGSGVR